MTLKYELPRSVGVQYAIGEKWRNNSRKNEEMERKQSQNKTKTPSCGCDWSDSLKAILHRNLEC